MNQKSYQAITAMLNAFPQSSADLRGLLLTYDQALTGVDDKAIEEAATRFIAGDVKEQSRTFAPSVPEFTQEARRIHQVLPYRGRPQLPPPARQYYREPTPTDRLRMGFKMSVLSAGLGRGNVDDVAEANAKGLEAMIALGHRWGVPVPDELLEQVAA